MSKDQAIKPRAHYVHYSDLSSPCISVSYTFTTTMYMYTNPIRPRLCTSTWILSGHAYVHEHESYQATPMYMYMNPIKPRLCVCTWILSDYAYVFLHESYQATPMHIYMNYIWPRLYTCTWILSVYAYAYVHESYQATPMYMYLNPIRPRLCISRDVYVHESYHATPMYMYMDPIRPRLCICAWILSGHAYLCTWILSGHAYVHAHESYHAMPIYSYMNSIRPRLCICTWSLSGHAYVHVHESNQATPMYMNPTKPHLCTCRYFDWTLKKCNVVFSPGAKSYTCTWHLSVHSQVFVSVLELQNTKMRIFILAFVLDSWVDLLLLMVWKASFCLTDANAGSCVGVRLITI